MFQPGTYNGRLKDAICTEAKTGTLQMALTFSIRFVWDGSQWASVDEQDRRVFVSLSDAAWQYSVAKLEALGFDGDFQNPRFSEAVQKDGVELSCTEDTYEGKTREKWELGRWGGGELEQASTEKVKRMNAKWAATTGGRKGKPASAPTTKAPPSSAPPPTEPPRTSTRDAAWGKLTQTWSEKKTEAEITALWHELVAHRGKPEDQFSPEDWGAVEAGAEIPF